MEQSSSNPRHFVIVGVLIVVSTVILNWLLSAALPLPVQASLQAIDIDWLFGLHVLLIAFLFSLVVVFMIYALIVFRRRDGDEGEGEHFEGNTKLEIAWTSAPMIFVIIFSVLGVTSLNKVTQAQDGEEIVKVVAQQWQFAFYYGDDEHEAMETGGTPYAELVLAVDQPYVMKMRSKDVLHAFWVPAFRVKQDILPGKDLTVVYESGGHGEEEHGEEEHSEEAAAEGDAEHAAEEESADSEEHSDDEAHSDDDGHGDGAVTEQYDFPTELRFTPNEIGTYTLRCAELCGGTHYAMRSPVYVLDADAYDRFVGGEDLYCILKDIGHAEYDESKYVESKCG